MATTSLEERLTIVEEEVAQLKLQKNRETTPASNPWLDQVFGAFADDPLFEEAVRYGREWRAAQDKEETDAPSGHRHHDAA